MGKPVVVNQPPTQGGFKTNPQAIEVVITKPEGPYFSDMLRPVAPVVVARSVAAPIGTAAGGGMCVMALEPTATGVTVNGTPVLDAGTARLFRRDAQAAHAAIRLYQEDQRVVLQKAQLGFTAPGGQQVPLDAGHLLRQGEGQEAPIV